MNKVLIVCLSPAIQRTLEFREVKLGSVNRSSKSYISISGKGINISRALSSKGVKSRNITHIGRESRGFFKREAREEGINLIPVYTGGRVRTCTTLLEERGRTTEIVEESQKVSRSTGLRLYSKFKRALKSCDIVVFTGSVAPGYNDNILPKMVQYTKNKGKIVVADTRGKALESIIQFKPDYIKINEDEFKETFSDSYLEIASDLIKKGTKLIVTRGSGDVSYLKNSKEEIFSPRINPSPINSTGCGDAFTAGLIYSIIEEESIESGVKKGCDFGYRNTLNYIPGSIK